MVTVRPVLPSASSIELVPCQPRMTHRYLTIFVFEISWTGELISLPSSPTNRHSCIDFPEVAGLSSIRFWA